MDFECPKCYRTWSTIGGTIEFYFRVESTARIDPNIRVTRFEYFIRFYNHICLKCRTDGKLKITRSRYRYLVKRLTHFFLNKTNSITAVNIQPIGHQGLGFRAFVRLVVKPHRHDLCKACWKGRCIACEACIVDSQCHHPNIPRIH